MISEQLSQEIKELADEGHKITAEAKDDGFIHLVFEAYPLPSGYKKACTKLLIKAPASYPNGTLDMFWTDEDLQYTGGQAPKEGISLEIIYGVKWMRFSWHPKKWNPGKDNLRTFLEFIDCRLKILK